MIDSTPSTPNQCQRQNTPDTLSKTQINRRNSSPLNLINSIVILILLFCFGSPIAWGQVLAATTDQAPAVPSGDHALVGTLSASVNPANGALSIRIPVPLPASRGKDLANFTISFDSNSADHLIQGQGVPDNYPLIWTDNISFLGQGGWSYGVPNVTYESSTFSYTNNTGTYDCYATTGYMLNNVDGDHQLGVSAVQTDGQLNCPNVGSYYNLLQPLPPIPYLQAGAVLFQAVSQPCPANSKCGFIPLTVTDLHGDSFNFDNYAPLSNGEITALPTIEDSNGNITNITTGNGSQINITDDLGRTALLTSGFGSSSGDTITVAGLQYKVIWSTSSLGGSSTISSQYYSGNPSDCSGIVNSGNSFNPVITSIVLPNNQSYQFQYTNGLLTKIIYPGGGYVRYTWGMGPVWDGITYMDGAGTSNCAARYNEPVVTSRNVSYDGTNETLEQDFTYNAPTWNGWSNWATRQTKVTTIDRAAGTSYITIYNYKGIGLPSPPNEPDTLGSGETSEETSVIHEDGAGNPIETLNYSYTDPELPPSISVEMADGETRETERDYGQASGAFSLVYVPTAKKEFDWGSNGTSGALLRQTVYSYESFPATPLFPDAPSILDRPSSVAVEDGNGCLKSLTDYFYDQTSVQGTSGVEGHDYTYYSSSYNNRGNLTTLSRWVANSDATCISPSSPGGYDLNTTYSHDDAGQLLSLITPLDGNIGKTTTTISYADNYDGGGEPGSTDAFPTTITNANNHRMQYSWYYNNGLLATSTDENGNTTSYQYNDPLYRLKQVNYPCTQAGCGETQYSYNDNSLPNSNQSYAVSREISSGQWINTTHILDGMGRDIETENTSDPAGTDYVLTTYDGEGRVLTRTNSYRSTSDPTYGIRSYTYDPLGRVTSLTDPDGAIVNTTYNGRATEVQDEGNGSFRVTRISQINGLGELAAVCEVTGQSVTPTLMGNDKTPVDCGLDIDNSNLEGFLTTYQYDTSGNLLSVQQGNALQVRSFSYDSLNRMISSLNPESNFNPQTNTFTYTNYVYDNAVASCGASGASAAPGELTCRTDSNDITTAFSYDPLGRILQKSYSDGTPTANFAYGQSAAFGYGISNPLGHLTSETAGSTADALSYDAMGRVMNNWQCFSSDCSSHSYDLAYTYDLLGFQLSSTNGAGTTFSYDLNSIGQLTSLTDPGTLISNLNYNALGQETTGTLGNGLTEARSYDSLGRILRLTEGGQLNGTGTPGTGSVTINGNEQSITINECPGNPYGPCWNTIYDGGGLQATVSSFQGTASWGSGSTSDTIASALASSLNASGSPVTASANGNVVDITANQNGSDTNYPLSASVQGWNSTYFSSPSFSIAASGSNLTGGSGSDEPTGTYHFIISYEPDGDIATSDDSVNGAWNYAYDAFNRLDQATCDNSGCVDVASGNGLQFVYDRYGNRWQQNYISNGSQAGPEFTFNGIYNGTSYVPINRIDGASYNPEGDLLYDGSHHYAYDAENRIENVDSGAAASYSYNGDGRRVVKTDSTGTFYYLYDLVGRQVAEINSSNGTLIRAEIYAGTRHLATYTNGTTYFNMADWVGTERGRLNMSDNMVQTCQSWPYGDELTCQGGNYNTISPMFMTGKERDQESGLDYFGARYDNSTYGRFMTPDWSVSPSAIPYSNYSDPQSLNLYLYVLDNPVNGLDANGHCWGGIFGHGCKKFNKVAELIFGTVRPPPVPAPSTAQPIAILHTSIAGGYSYFMWTDSHGVTHVDQVVSLVKAVKGSKPGAGGPFTGYVIRVRHKKSVSEGNTQIIIVDITTTHKYRWLHGGGTHLKDPFAPRQKLLPTYGCTRLCNEDVDRIGAEIENFMKHNYANKNPLLNNPNPILYTRTKK